ncbi:MAG: 2-dehydropantoate 2-reductase [Rhodospirillales bacterium]|nr:2-dehydropantoate 2-reductase [Rhodospirillales bacterium]
MKIAVFGAGGVGGYFGAKLAKAGADVHFVARGRHLEAIRQHGLGIESALGDIVLKPANATDDPAAIGPVDLAIVAVKLYDTDDAAKAMKPLVGPETTVMSLQNGVTANDTLEKAFGRAQLIGGSCSIATVIGRPGVVRHTGTMASMAFGEWDGRRTPRVEALLDTCRKAGIDATLSDDIEAVIWSKFIFLSAFSGICCTMRLPIGPIRKDPETRALLRRAMEEVLAIARRKGVKLADDLIERRMAFADGLPAEMYASMYHDLAAGKRLELKWLSGAVVEMGRALGVPTPAHESYWLALKLHADGRRT